MMIAIHSEKGTFSDYWIEYCKKNQISYKVVNCYSTDIINELDGCNALMWHHHHGKYQDLLFAKQLLFSLEHANIKVFPDFYSNWHFDDKIGQKYLLEKLNAPLVKSYVFYTQDKARNWIEESTFPKVFKLRGGAGSHNVKLIQSKTQAHKIVRKSFGKGHSQFNKIENFKEKVKDFGFNKNSFLNLFKGIYRFIIPPELSRVKAREKGYVYFQDFIPNNDFDIRIIVIKNKAFGIKRLNRKNDFRASGSGKIIYEKAEIDKRCIEISFETNKTLKSQCVAFDFVFDESNNPLIVEISYGYDSRGYISCEGFWDQDLNWNEGKFLSQEWQIEDIINKLSE